MKQHKFKLEALLKLREFKEEKVKIELGRINQEIATNKAKIEELNLSIDLGYQSQSAALGGDGSQGKMIGFYPMYVDGARAHIKALEAKNYSLQKKYQTKLLELNKCRGDVKVMESLKEKDLIKFKKEEDKKLRESIEDIIQIRRIVNK